jgi:hypothetical protein
VEIVLFTGHMVDSPSREHSRFPPHRVPEVRNDIAEAIRLIVDPEARAVSGLACGGDLLFADEWRKTGRRLQAHLPRHEAEFLDESVRFAGEEWVQLFEEVTEDPEVEVVGPDEEMLLSDDPHSLNVTRMLEAAREGAAEIHGLVLWDGRGGDGPGGTQDMISAVLEAGGSITILRPS